MVWPRTLPVTLAAMSLVAASGSLAQTASTAALLDSSTPAPSATLKVCLRLEDQTPFLGAATVRVLPTQGNELLGMPADAPGEFLFSGVSSGNYNAVVSAPGYTALSLSFKIDQGPRQKSLFVPMKPRLSSASEERIEVVPQP